MDENQTSDEVTQDTESTQDAQENEKPGDEGSSTVSPSGGSSEPSSTSSSYDKTCAKCGLEKPESDFYRNKKPKDGLQRQCKSCQNAHKDKKKFSFPTISLCPRCGNAQTQAYSTQGKVQYRKCLSAICRRRYHVIGTKIKPKTRKENSNGQDKKDQTQTSA